MTQAEARTIPYEVFQRERSRRIEAEKDRDHWKNEFYRLRKIRRAPVLQPMTKDVLEECLHVQDWGKVSDEDGRKRANFKTIAKHLNTTGNTIKRHAERLEKLGIIDIREFQGLADEHERKYIHVKTEKINTLDQLKDPDKVVPKQGGDRFHRCMKCDGEMEIRTITRKRTKIMLHCIKCHHETTLQEDLEDVIEDTGWHSQGVPNKKSQNHPDDHCVYTPPDDADEDDIAEEDGGTVSTDDAQNQVGFNASASYARSAVSIDPEVYRNPDWLPELKKQRIWVVGRAVWNEKRGKFDKVPYIADALGKTGASHSAPSTWRTFEYALATYEQSQSWKGNAEDREGPFHFLEVACCGFTLLDGDHCRNKETGEVSEDATEKAQRINSYTEGSYSEDGIHTLAWGIVPAGRRQGMWEMYSQTRFCALTGNVLPGFTQTMEHRQEEITALYQELFPPKPTPLWDMPIGDDEDSDVDEDELMSVVSQAKQAFNATRFSTLWSGDASGYPHSDGSPDHSRADQALCTMLVYWCRRVMGKVTREMIDYLFRKSKLYREKWEREDYRNWTINQALAFVCQEEGAA